MVEVFVRNLRRKIDDPYPDKLIQTVRGVGYTVRADGDGAEPTPGASRTSARMGKP